MTGCFASNRFLIDIAAHRYILPIPEDTAVPEWAYLPVEVSTTVVLRSVSGLTNILSDRPTDSMCKLSRTPSAAQVRHSFEHHSLRALTLQFTP